MPDKTASRFAPPGWTPSADHGWRTPPMFAAAQGRLELVQVLLAGGADVEAQP